MCTLAVGSICSVLYNGDESPLSSLGYGLENMWSLARSVLWIHAILV